ncbi:MAG: glycosyltransferase family 39 protein [Myxococcota bacterium]|nr:glycosyltransferase family 39 protein [Myxococcota bacterium]
MRTSEKSHPKRYGRKTLTRWDVGAAAVLFFICMAILLATSSMGTTRDESFYFRYSSIYQDWFERLAGDTDATGPVDSPMGRKDVSRTWSQNFEHPPLMKVLFGLSWRWLANKYRDLQIGNTPAGPELIVTNLGMSDGFAVGDTVVLYGPRMVQATSSKMAPQNLGNATVVERDVGRAVLNFDGDIHALTVSCKSPQPIRGPHPWIHGCRAASSGTFQCLDEITAMRLPGQFFAAMLVAILYVFGTELFGRWAGLFAGLSFFFIPRYFFHAHLSCFDMPVTTLIVGTTWTFWRSLHSPRWAWITAILWGLGLLTKLNAFFIPIPLLAAWLIPPVWRRIRGYDLEQLPPKMQSVRRTLLALVRLDFHISFPPMPRAFLLMPPIGIVMLYLGWPQLWYDPVESFAGYVSFHLKHVHYLQHYFGHILSAPPFPWDYPWVLTLLTVPVPIFAVGGVGLWRLIRTPGTDISPELKVLLLTSILFPIVLISLPTTPIFGGVKHWMATVAFFGLAGGLGFEWILQAFSKQKFIARTTASFVILMLTLSSGAYASFRYQAYGTSYYNEVAGGIRGAADLRMHRQFWGYGSRLALEWINANARKGASVAFHNTTYDSFQWYQRTGLLREDLRWTRDPRTACRRGDLYVFHHQESFAQERITAAKRLNTDVPVTVFSVDDVPVVSIFQCGQPGLPKELGAWNSK